MENISKSRPFTDREQSYQRQRYKNRMFSAIVEMFAEEAERRQITKRDLAEWLQKDPAQITRWLSTPSNLTLETVSDILQALGAEEDPTIRRFAEKAIGNYMHPLIARSLNAEPSPNKLAKAQPTSSGEKIFEAPSQKLNIYFHASAS